MKRKPKSNRIYRMETTYPDEWRHLNRTRQTLNHAVYERWRECDRLHHDARAKVEFFMGDIKWVRL